MEDSEQSKSEEATPFKLMRARRKGTVARGTDLGFLTSLAAFFGFAWIIGPQLGHTVARSIQVALIGGSQVTDGSAVLFQTAIALFRAVVPFILLLAGAVFATVLLFELVQTGIVFSGEALRPDFSRLNPARGLKRVFSLRILIETGKQIVKLCTYAAVGYFIIRGAISSDIGLVTDGARLAATLIRLLFRLLSFFLLLAVVFAGIDQLIVRRDFLKRMRMSRRELRQELRDREGEPRLKQKRKQMHAEFAKASQSLRNIRKADVLITNPSHLAVALRYDRACMLAPTVVSLGANQFAQRLKRLAFLYGVPIIENRALARELYRHARLLAPIPEESFAPVAAIYNAVRKQAGA
jgi:flagellar biosynthetic protein FlhB